MNYDIVSVQSKQGGKNMDCNSYSYAPYMLDGKPEKSQNIEKCIWCKHAGNCTGWLKDCNYEKDGDQKHERNN